MLKVLAIFVLSSGSKLKFSSKTGQFPVTSVSVMQNTELVCPDSVHSDVGALQIIYFLAY